MTTCDYCGRLVNTTKWAHDGDEEDLCVTCLKRMAAYGEALLKVQDEGS